MTSRRRRTTLVLVRTVVVAAATLVSACRRPEKVAVSASDYVGDGQCLACHTDKQSYEHTAHQLSSQLPSSSTILGSFREGENVLRTPNPHLYYRMFARGGSFFQSAIAGIPPDTITERFDVVVGAGRKGQTYLYWRGDQLFQLPVSYWVDPGEWGASPGYREGVVNFDRPIEPRCLECHATYATSKPALSANNRYDRADLKLGISCEKCHGPGREHIARQQSMLGRLEGAAIVNPAKLSRAREIDVCALCHSGIGKETAPAFSYIPGDPLHEYLETPPPPVGEPIDVHGNQVALLERSACFRSSQMTCNTCHDVHVQQRNAAAFSSRCLTCHTVESCGMEPTLGRKIAQDCVDCHMPEQTSSLIVSSENGQRLQVRIRNHWIKVYPGTADPHWQPPTTQ